MSSNPPRRPRLADERQFLSWIHGVMLLAHIESCTNKRVVRDPVYLTDQVRFCVSVAPCSVVIETKLVYIYLQHTRTSDNTLQIHTLTFGHQC